MAVGMTGPRACPLAFSLSVSDHMKEAFNTERLPFSVLEGIQNHLAAGSVVRQVLHVAQT